MRMMTINLIPLKELVSQQTLFKCCKPSHSFMKLSFGDYQMLSLISSSIFQSSFITNSYIGMNYIFKTTSISLFSHPICYSTVISFLLCVNDSESPFHFTQHLTLFSSYHSANSLSG